MAKGLRLHCGGDKHGVLQSSMPRFCERRCNGFARGEEEG